GLLGAPLLEQELGLHDDQRGGPAVVREGLGQDLVGAPVLAALESDAARQEAGRALQRAVAPPGLAQQRLGLVEVPLAQPLAAQGKTDLGPLWREPVGAGEVGLGGPELT